MTQTADTTVAFASTEGNTDTVYLIRIPDGTARTLTWPSGMIWNGGSEPNLASGASDYQVFKLTTRDNGATWYGSIGAEDTPIRTLYVWGKNQKGLLGQNESPSGRYGYSSPVQIPGTNWSSFDASTEAVHWIATKNDGTLWSWGYNDYGAIGNNTSGANASYSSPVQVPGTTWSSGKAGMNMQSYGVKTDGTLWAWGQNANGQLGQNDRTQRSSPIQIPGTTWSSGVTKGSDTVNSSNARAQIKTDGTMWVWGYANYGELGLNDRTERSSPVQLPGTTWSAVRGIYRGFAAIKTDGTLWAWGHGYRGQLGQNNTTTYYSSPVQIPGTTWSKLSGARYGVTAIKTDGTLWAWGSGTNGELGQDDAINRSSPVQVPGTTWSDIGGGLQWNSAIKTDGTLWAWGSNSYGGLGQNNRTNYSSPIQIPGTNWVVTKGNLSNLASQTPTLN